MDTFISRGYSIPQCKHYNKTLFVFSDNEERSGTADQAVIRDQPNAIGIAVCKTFKNYYTDEEYSMNCIMIDSDIKRIKAYAEENELTSIGFPKDGIGSTVGFLTVRAPKTFCYLTMRLLEEFQFNNLAKI